MQNASARDILAEQNTAKREEIIDLLKKAYWMEMETVMNYVSSSVNPDGVRGREIAQALETDIQEELAHGQLFARRIKDLYGVVPGSMDFKPQQKALQPPKEQTDTVHFIKGVIDAERGAIEHYNKIIEMTEQVDPATNDMVIDVLRDEQGHMRMFEGFLREYQAEGKA